MKKTTPTRADVFVLKQMLNLIPRGLINCHALETGVALKAQSFSLRGHLSSMLFAQLSHAMGLNDVCDWLRLKAPVLSRIGVTPSSKNGLSNANLGALRGVYREALLVRGMPRRASRLALQ